MLRMAHRLITQSIGILTKSQDDTPMHPEAERQLKAVIATSEIVIADNVAEFLSNNPDKMWGERDLPYLIPPFKSLFVEYNTPHMDAMKQIGALIITHDDQSKFDRSIWNDDVRWVISVWLFASIDGNAAIFDGQMNIGVKIDGKFSGMYDKSGLWSPASLPIFLAISFMHCKGVVKSESPNESPSEKWIRRKQAPSLKYHILEINPFKDVLKTEGQSESTGIKKALHICRGHFCTYTEEKPLFGHFVGTVWKPSHVRGDIKNGAVIKDYSVKSPTPE